MTQVAEAITEGWEFVIQLPNDQAVVRSPAQRLGSGVSIRLYMSSFTIISCRGALSGP